MTNRSIPPVQKSEVQFDTETVVPPKKWVIFGAVIVILAISFGVFQLLSAMRQAPPQKQAKPVAPLVEVVPLSPMQVHFSIPSQGTVVAKTRTVLVAQVSGTIRDISPKLENGGFFRKGEWMATIDPRDYEIAVHEAQARLDAELARLQEAQAQAEQAREEWKLTGRPLDKAPPLALKLPQVAQAEASVAIARAGLERAQRNLEKTKIVAPYDAFVESVNVDLGQFVSPGAQLATIFSVDAVEVRLPVLEQDVPFLRPISEDAPVSVTLTADNGREVRTWQAVLVRREAKIDERNRVLYVIARLDDPFGLYGAKREAPLRPGLFVQAEIQGIDAEGIIRIPRLAIHGSDQILVVDGDNKLRTRTLAPIRGDREYVYVKSGIESGDRLVTTPLESWVDGMTVRIAEAKPSGHGDAKHSASEEGKAASSEPVDKAVVAEEVDNAR